MQRRIRSLILSGLGLVLLGGCDGGGSGLATDAPTASARYDQQCAPNNPFVDDALASTRIASLDSEKQWVAAYLDEAYLWYAEIPGVDPARPEYSNDTDVAGSLQSYFDALLTPATTASGKRKDEFSFIYPTRLWNEFSEAGSELGYGMQLQFNATPPRNTRVVYVEAASSAGDAGVERGLRVVAADGVSTESADSADVDTLNAALFPASSGESHAFTFERTDGSRYTATLTAAEVVRNPVPEAKVLQSGGRAVGYLLFNDHLATAEQPLIDAVTQFRDAGIEDLVLDLRYNGGGFLYIASQLAYMIAGAEPTGGKIFERLQFSDKRRGDQSDFPFLPCSFEGDLDCAGATPLPTLNLQRVHVIATDGTCSASESIINGLRGVDIDVRLIGGTTCGKPYGFTAKDNCGISYFPIEFAGVNAKGFGDYADGFTPDCATPDDLDRALGDPQEAMLATALSLQAGNACGSTKALPLSAPLQRSPLRENRLLRPAVMR